MGGYWMKDIAEQLLQQKKKLQEAKEQDINIRGRIEAMMENLKKDFGCDTLEAANNKSAEMKSSLETMQSALDKALGAFQRKYQL
jgi:uncharacterized phage infection (PIP) family protein YhgE